MSASPAHPGPARPAGPAPAQTGLRRPLCFACAAAAGFALDQLSKTVLFALIPLGQTRALVPGVLNLTPGLNPGLAFGRLSSSPHVATVLALVAIAFLSLWYARTRRTGRQGLLWSQMLFAAGAAGNMLDRLWQGQVRDFLDFVPRLPLVGKWPVFNCADVFICVGFGLAVATELWPGGKKEEEGTARGA